MTLATTAAITIEGTPFCAAHSGLHAGAFEALHGHTFRVWVRVEGGLDEAAMVTDFVPVQTALAQAIRPLHRRTLMPQDAPGVTVHADSERRCLSISDDRRTFTLPASDVVLLPVANTSTEAIAAYLLDQLGPALAAARVRRAELTLAESPTAQATVTWRVLDASV